MDVGHDKISVPLIVFLPLNCAYGSYRSANINICKPSRLCVCLFFSAYLCRAMPGLADFNLHDGFPLLSQRAFVRSTGPRKEIKVKGKLHLKEFLGITVELIKTLVREGGREERAKCVLGSVATLFFHTFSPVFFRVPCVLSQLHRIAHSTPPPHLSPLSCPALWRIVTPKPCSPVVTGCDIYRLRFSRRNAKKNSASLRGPHLCRRCRTVCH